MVEKILASTMNAFDREDKTDERFQRRKAYFAQFISILSGYILMLDTGAHMTWTSPSLEYLKSNESHIHVSVSEQSWLLSIENLSALIGHCLYPIFMDRIGRKYTLLIFGVIQLISWILINLACNFIFLFIARIIVGISYGATIPVFQLYIGEVAGKSIRGILLSLIKICINIGAFLMVTSGAFLSHRTMNLVMISFPILALFLFPFMSESPYFNLMKGRDEEAIRTLMKYSTTKDSETVMKKIERMKSVIEEKQQSTDNVIQELFNDRGSRKSFIILMVTSITYGFTGYVAIRSMAQEILSYSGSSLKSEYETMILMGVQIFAGLPATQLIDLWGRRPVYLISGISSAFILISIGLFFFLKNFLGTDVSSITWLPLIGLILFMFACDFGIGMMQFVYGGELLSVKVKGIALMCALCVVNISIFTAKQLLKNLSNAGFIYIAFWLFTSACIIGPLIVWYTMPETKGKNLEEVLILMKAKKKATNQNII